MSIHFLNPIARLSLLPFLILLIMMNGLLSNFIHAQDILGKNKTKIVIVTKLFENLDTDKSKGLSASEFITSSPQSIQEKRRIQFYYWDINFNKTIELDEFINRGHGEHPRTLNDFRYRDYDENDQLDLKEFRNGFRGHNTEALNRLFLNYDLNKNQFLDYSEFSKISSIVPVNQLDNIDDPIKETVILHFNKIKKSLHKWDLDSDNQLNQKEFLRSQIPLSVPGLEKTSFNDWDNDKNGLCSLKEIEELLDIAHGIRDSSGDLLRLEYGITLNLRWFIVKDRDNNHELNYNEYSLAGYGSKSDKLQFQKADIDQNKELNFSEFKTILYHNIAPATLFDRFDTNLDGKLDPEEITHNAGSWQKQLSQFIFPGFDTDKNNSLSINEFLYSPLSNPVGKWFNIRKDHNGDDQLSFSEYLSEPTPFCLSLQAHYFSRFDLNNDQYLSDKEYFFTPNHKNRKLFAKHDQNQDGSLDEAEYLATLKPEHQTIGKQEFRLFDHNHNSQLEYKEYLNTPAIPLAQRNLPDPITERVAEHLSALRQKWNDWDQDQDRQLNQKEFMTSQLTAAVPGLEGTTFVDWDRDGNGQVSEQDVALLLEIAYGVRSVDGQLLREPSGRVVNWMLFQHLDTNGDNQLSQPELKVHLKKEPLVKEVFAAADVNQDGQLVLEEWKTNKDCWIDPVYYFKRIDQNGDAKLDQKELAQHTGFQRELADYLLPGFDVNQDGVLSLHEYRNTPITNPIVKWHVLRKDKNRDGAISPDEFIWNKGVAGQALVQEYFAKLDGNDDQKLDSEEYVFYSTAQTPRKLFAKHDQNQDGSLDEAEYLATLKPEHQTIGKQEFRLYDHNHNSQLEYKEYLNTPAIPLAQRNLPDPVTERVAEHLSALQQKWNDWDQDQNRQLNQKEFTASQLTAAVPGLEGTTFADWDRDGNGQVSEQDVALLLEIAYGVRSVDGQLLREPSGRVVNWMLFQHLDTNGDNQLSQPELKVHLKKEPLVKEVFAAADVNQDGQLVLEEWKTNKDCWIDPVYYFKRIDQNGDAKLDQKELAQHTGFQRELAEYLLPSFDVNQDRVLSLHEYRNTPITNPIVKWHVLRKDKNRDGAISPDEFIWNKGVAGQALVQEYFAKLDDNHDQKLDPKEYVFYSTAQTPQKLFAKHDQNQDGSLDEAEYLATLKPEHQTIGKQEFRLFDHNNNSQLEYEEYLNTPAIPLAQRNLPDPVTERVAEHLSALRQKWNDWDQDQDRQLNQKEFTASQLTAAVPGLEGTTFVDWDRDGNGQVSEQDVALLLEIAYGVRSVDGQLLREPSGRVVNWMLFQHLDTNGDNQLSQPELKVHLKKEPLVKEVFTAADVNQDGQLVLEEWKTSKDCWIDPVYYFKRVDQNGDAKLAPQELAQHTGFQRELADYLLPGFDVNQDGVLSLHEYRNTPITNPLVKWHVLRKDKNRDGAISPDEFIWNKGVSGQSLVQEYFAKLDGNDDQKLDPEEYVFYSTAQTPQKLFAKHDQNQNGSLGEAEYLATLKPEHQTIGKQEFRLFDHNHNSQLEYEEYLNTPAIPLAQRNLPDPVTERVAEHLSALQQKWNDWDQDQDQQLNAKEFTASQLTAAVPGLEGTTFADWDRDGNGQVSEQDVALLLEIAYGVRSVDGQLLREPSGRVVNWMLFQHLDTNGDNQLSQPELKVHLKKEPLVKEVFAAADVNQDGQLVLEEWKTNKDCWIDPVYYFKRIDQNGDAKLDLQELAQHTGFQRELADYLLPGFDVNQDGVLSLHEYRNTPITNPLVKWHVSRKDKDNDGSLSLVEFDWDKGVSGQSLIQEYFAKLDGNHDQKLGPEEYFSQLNLVKAPRELVFKNLDKNKDSSLSFEEIFIATKKRIDNNNVVKYEQIMSNVENVFNQIDLNHDKKLNINEFQKDQALAVLPPYSYNTRSLNKIQSGSSFTGTNNSDPVSENDYTLWIVLVFNILLVSAVSYYLLKVKPQR